MFGEVANLPTLKLGVERISVVNELSIILPVSITEWKRGGVDYFFSFSTMLEGSM